MRKRFWLLSFLVVSIVGLGWFTSFKVKPLDKVDVDDVFFECLELSGMVALYAMSLASLKNRMIDASFLLILVSYSMDVMDEFTKEPEFFNTTLQSLLLFGGLVGVGLGLGKRLSEMERKTYMDPLTGLLNRTYFEEWIEGEAKNLKPPYGVLVVDLDNLKRINDEFSHTAGDIALRTVASTLKDSLRSEDLAFRYGGDEFVAILPGVSEKEAGTIAERFSKNLCLNSKYMRFPIEASYGFSGTAEGERKDFKEVFEEADRKLLEMKRKKKTIR